MAKIKSVKWGTPPEVSIVLQDLNSFSKSKIRLIGIEHIKSGFTDNVFLIQYYNEEKGDVKVILKEFTEDWHQRESIVYSRVLNKDHHLLAPKMLYSNANRIYLEYLSPKQFVPLEKEMIGSLYDWIIYKGNYYKTKVIRELIEDETIKRHYLMEKPINKLSSIVSNRLNLEINQDSITQIINRKEEIEKIFERKSSVLTLEHGDLELQNLFFDARENKLAIIDWTNAKFSDGLTDVNQFIENCENWNIETNQYISRFEHDLHITDFSFYLQRNKLFSLLNKINYYIDKIEEGYTVSETKKRPIRIILDEYLGKTTKALSHLID